MKTKLTHHSSTRSLPCRIGFTVLFLLVLQQIAHAQTGVILVASVIGGGGSENGTIGQWDGGAITSEADTSERPALLGGFWNAVEVPRLRIQSIGGSVLIAWPASFLGFQLEQSSTTSAGAAWGNVSQAVNVANEENQIIIAIGSGNRFFRLRKP